MWLKTGTVTYILYKFCVRTLLCTQKHTTNLPICHEQNNLHIITHTHTAKHCFESPCSRPLDSYALNENVSMPPIHFVYRFVLKKCLVRILYLFIFLSLLFYIFFFVHNSLNPIQIDRTTTKTLLNA